MPELPLIYRNKYRERIPMNSKLIEMDSKGKLQGDAAYIFMKTKPVEEFYDLKFDPYEVDNLIDNPSYSSKIDQLRSELKRWQKEIDDKGFIPENEIVKSFWPNMIQPATENVTFSTNNQGKLELNSATDGASIGFQIDDKIGTENWDLYHKPIELNKDQKIAARAIRIGYKASEITSN